MTQEHQGMELLVVGHFSRDLLVTPELTREALGGGVAYAMLGPPLGALGVGVMSRVGTDFEAEYLRALKESGINITGIRTSGPRSTRFVNRYDADGRRTQSIDALAPPLRAEDYLPQHMRASIVHFCPLTANEVHISCIEAARGSGALVSLDVQGYLRESKTGPVQNREWTERDEVLRLVDVVKADDVELLMSVPGKTEYEAVRKVLSQGPRILLVTRERRGSTIYTQHSRIDIPVVLPSRYMDTTGCGDTYAMSFLLEYVRCGDIRRAGLFAATCASFNIETIGPYGMPSRADVERRMQAYL
ncbi:MAG: carbohydrate kinase family protein [Candidatus Thorarchaeota archaeon]|nr:carbohydrate kinase family protein [Candidatus Thorarchaeota archaeon]